MSTPVIQSTSIGSNESAASVTITKPVGLVWVINGSDVFTYQGTTDILDEAGWTTIHTSKLPSNSGDYKAYWKIATSGDVAAANFTFDISGGSADSLRAIMFRITGHSATAPIGNNYINGYTDATLTPTWNPNFEPKTSDALLLFGIFNTNLVSGATVSGYTISGTNPTWTEQYDNNEGTDHVLGIASAASNSADAITSLSATTSASTSIHLTSLISICADTNVIAIPNSVTLRIQQSTPTPIANTLVTPASVSIRAQLPTPNTRVRDNKWVNETTNPTTWTNEPL